MLTYVRHYILGNADNIEALCIIWWNGRRVFQILIFYFRNLLSGHFWKIILEQLGNKCHACYIEYDSLGHLTILDMLDILSVRLSWLLCCLGYVYFEHYIIRVSLDSGSCYIILDSLIAQFNWTKPTFGYILFYLIEILITQLVPKC